MSSPRHRELTELLLRLGRRQHGAVSHRQLVAHSVPRGAIDARRDSGHLLPVCAGVYAVGRELRLPEGGWTAAVLAAGPGAFLSRRSAAALWGILQPRSGLIEVVRLDSRTPRRFRLDPPGMVRSSLVEVRRSERLEGQTGARLGIAVTSVNRTLLDLASTISSKHLRSAFNEADRLGLLDQESLVRYANENRGQVGSPAFMRLVQTRHPETAATRSELEAMFLRVCRREGLPLPAVNSLIGGFEVDCVWPESGLVIELDGYEFHRGRMTRDRDTNRDFALKQAGYRVTRVTYFMVRDTPAELAQYIRQEIQLPGRSDRP